MYESVTKYTYDSKGNVLTEVIHSGTELALTKTHTYDIYGNILSSVNSGKDVKPITVYNVYDASGRFISKKYQNPAAAVNTYVYDAWGNVISENDETDPSNVLTTINTYDGWGKLSSAYLPDGSMKNYSYNWENDYSLRKQYYVLESEGCFFKGVGSLSTQPWVKTWYDKAGYETEQNSIGPKNIAISKSTYYNVGGKVTNTINKSLVSINIC
jgi:YD repeat-containing protein